MPSSTMPAVFVLRLWQPMQYCCVSALAAGAPDSANSVGALKRHKIDAIRRKRFPPGSLSHYIALPRLEWLPEWLNFGADGQRRMVCATPVTAQFPCVLIFRCFARENGSALRAPSVRLKTSLRYSNFLMGTAGHRQIQRARRMQVGFAVL